MDNNADVAAVNNDGELAIDIRNNITQIFYFPWAIVLVVVMMGSNLGTTPRHN